MKGWLGLCLCALASAAVTNVKVAGTTPTQAVIGYTAPDATTACTIEVSESETYAPLVNDVNPALFAGSASDARAGAITSGRERVFVIGTRTAAMTGDGRYRSRALAANTRHYFRITCGSDTATGTFVTANIAAGNLYPEAYPTDPAAPGNFAWPTIDFSQTANYVDPVTGAMVRKFIPPGIGTAGYELSASGAWSWCAPEERSDSTGVRGFACLLKDGAGKMRLFFVRTDTGEARYLSYVAVPWHAVGSHLSGTCGSASSADPNYISTYCVANQDGGPELYLIRAKYHVGGRSGCADPADYRHWTPPTADAVNCNISFELLHDHLLGAVEAVEPAFLPRAKYAKYINARLLRSGRYYVISWWHNQDALGWTAVFDLSTTPPTVHNAYTSFSKYPARWCALHSTLDEGNEEWIRWLGKDTVGGSGTAFLGPYKVQVTAVEGSGDGSLPSTLAQSCSAVTDARWIAEGATGNHCVRITVSGEPCDDSPHADEIALAGSYPEYGCSWHAGWTDPDLPLAEGDVLEDAGERMLLVKDLGANQWLALRNYRILAGDPPAPWGSALASHAAGFYLGAKCSAVAGNGHFWINLAGDARGDAMIADRPFSPTAHGDAQGEVVIQADGAGGLKVRKAAIPEALNQPQTGSTRYAGNFAGATAFNLNYVQTHAGYRQVSAPAAERGWAADYNPHAVASGYSSNLWPSPTTWISGALYRLTSLPLPLSRKKIPTAIWAGGYLLTDISGPGSRLAETAADNWKYCIADFAGECVAGSSAGQVFVNVPGISTDGTCTKGTTQRDPCFAFPTAGWARQIGLFAWAPDGSNSRVLTSAFHRYGSSGNYANMVALPDASWALVSGHGLNGTNTEVLLVRLPPWPARDSVNRTTFVPVPVTVAAAPAGAASLVAEFGYNANFRCTQRDEVCIANQATVNESVPFYWAGETWSGLACAAGCTVVIPGLPQRVLYYRVRYLDAAGVTMATGRTEVAVTP